MRLFVPLVFAVWFSEACRHEPAVAAPSEVEAPAALTSVATTPAPSATPTPEAPTPEPGNSPLAPEVDDGCEPATQVDPRLLTATWPQRLGQRVRFTARIERALDITNYLVTARGHRFVVMMGPDQGWEGSAERVFSVLGSTNAALQGRVTLPHLVLEGPDVCPP